MQEESISVIKDKELSKSMDYQYLRKEALTITQNISGNKWTDYNVHDPGVTILEQFCYALTDIAYRTNLSIETLLFHEGDHAKISRANMLIPAEQAFPSGPVTLDDYRILLLDKFPSKLANCWVNVIYDHSEGIQGLYKVTLLLKSDYRQAKLAKKNDSTSQYKFSKIKKEVGAYFSEYRNLCEDIEKIEILEPEKICIKADIDIYQDEIAEEVLAEILFQVEHYFNTVIKFSTLEYLENAGLGLDEIFDIPSHKHGFITKDQLLPKQQEFYVSKIADYILDVKGVRNVRNLNITQNGILINGDIIRVANDKYLTLGISGYHNTESIFKGFDITLFKGGIVNSYLEESVVYSLDLKEAKTHRKYEVKTKPKENKKDRITTNKLTSYESIQRSFPGIYGVGEYTPAKEDGELRKAQSAQLKGYLMFFDQIMSNHLAQLSKISELFDVRNIDIDNIRTYFTQLLGPNISDADYLIRKKLPAIPEFPEEEWSKERYSQYPHKVQKEDFVKEIALEEFDKLITQKEKLTFASSPFTNNRILSLISQFRVLDLTKKEKVQLNQLDKIENEIIALLIEEWLKKDDAYIDGLIRKLVFSEFEKLSKYKAERLQRSQLYKDKAITYSLLKYIALVQGEVGGTSKEQDVVRADTEAMMIEELLNRKGSQKKSILRRLAAQEFDTIREQSIAHLEESVSFDNKEITQLILHFKTLDFSKSVKEKRIANKKNQAEIKAKTIGLMVKDLMKEEQFGHFSQDNLDSVMLQFDHANERKNRILTHMLARFGERFTTDFHIKFNSLLEGESQETIDKKIISLKSIFLQKILNLNRFRARGLSYRKKDALKSTIPLQRKVSLLLNIENRANQKLASLDATDKIKTEKLTSVDIIKNKNQEVNIEYITPSRKPTEKIASSDKSNKITFLINSPSYYRYLFKYGLNRSNYKVVEEEGKATVYFIPPGGGHSNKLFEAESHVIAKEKVSGLIAKLKNLNAKNEGFHIIEHVLLRPVNDFGHHFFILGKDKQELFRSKKTESKEVQEGNALDAILLACFHNNYKQVKKHIIIKNGVGREIARSLQSFKSAVEAQNFIDQSVSFYKEQKELDDLSEYAITREYQIERRSAKEFNSKLSIVYSGWTSRFHNQEFLQLFQQTLFNCAPAHLEINMVGLGFDEMRNFEKLYFQYMDEIAHPKSENQHALAELSKNIMTILIGKQS